jgi:lipoprotein-releasing system permease protein
VLALTVIIAVMNGFQLGFIESILEISSGHIRIEGFESRQDCFEMGEKLRAVPMISAVVPFEELNVLLRGRQANPRGALIRGVPGDALALDTGLAQKLEIEDGSFDLSGPMNIVLGAELARYLVVSTGDQVSFLSITGGIRENEEGRSLSVAGIFRSGFYEYDLGWGFVSIETAAELAGEASPDRVQAVKPVLGIKLKNRWQDRRAMDEIRRLIPGPDITISSWRDYNRAFFSALRTEKLMMFILVGLIFIVVGLNIFQAQRRIVLERREEIGLLRALGASDTAVRLVFVWDGFVIGFTGAAAGLALGLLIAFHIPAVFSFLESAVNFFIYVINTFSALMGGNISAEEFAVFSPQIFYIKEIPSRVIPMEAVLIFLFGFLSALLAAWFASGKVSGTRPAEVLRYE